MSLTSIWNELQYRAASLRLYEPEGVRQDLMKQGWKYETEILPVASPTHGFVSMNAVTVVKTPEGVAIMTDDDARVRYNGAYQLAVDRVFSRAPAP